MEIHRMAPVAALEPLTNAVFGLAAVVPILAALGVDLTWGAMERRGVSSRAA
jgi:hypothetical protein